MKKGFGVVGKKGLSPVIASVLLIALVLVLATIVFLWARGLVTEQIEKFGQPVENLCSDLDYEAELISTGYGWELEVVNRGNTPIYQFDIAEVNGGNTEIKSFPMEVDAGASGRQAVLITSGTEKIIVYPALLGRVRGKKINKAVTCTEYGKTYAVN